MLLILGPGISCRASDIVDTFLLKYDIDHTGIAFGRITGTRTLYNLYLLHIGGGIGLEHLQHIL